MSPRVGRRVTDSEISAKFDYPLLGDGISTGRIFLGGEYAGLVSEVLDCGLLTQKSAKLSGASRVLRYARASFRTGAICSSLNRTCLKHFRPGRQALTSIYGMPKGYRGIDRRHTFDGVFSPDYCQLPIDKG